VKQIRKRLTYANVMSSIAVFLILGGATALAANQLAKNSVGTKQLKKNAVVTAKIKKNAITAAKIKKNAIITAKIKKGAVTGAKVKLSSLGTVPSAANADNATNAVHAATAGSSEQFKTWFATASVGQTVNLLAIGPFSYTGECTAGPHAVTYAETNQANSAADSYAAESGYETSTDEQNPWDPGHKVSIGYESDEHHADGTSQWVGPYDGSDTQLSADGHTYVNTFASVGTILLGADCVFTGHAFVLSR
jgi:hypothetical protein